MKTFLTNIRASVVSTVVLALVCCGFYPVAVWAVAQMVFHDKANGSLITDASGTVRGSRLLGQSFSSDKYFIPRPSAAGAGYDAIASGGSNLGPTSRKLVNGTIKGSSLAALQPGGPLRPGPDVVDYDGLKLRIIGYCDQNGIAYQLLLGGRPADPKLFKDAKGDYDQVKLVQAFNDDATPDAKTLTVVPAFPVPADAVTTSGSGLDPHISLRNAEIQATRV
ncbi:MAG: K+-transporting ATPase, subunit, partial [Verrucomicrobiaceae bacterium]|nr:K+-transporting ATPase, subunit [Verrucomicrobiaceae bacterium]